MAEKGAQTVRAVIRSARHAALATRDARTGAPFVSLVAMATDIAGHPVMCLSALARHSVNLRNDAVASLLVNEERGGDPLAEARITVLGRVEALEDQNAAQRFLARHPAARVYAGFADFAFYRLVPTEGHLVAGFGRIRDAAADELVLTGQHLRAISLTEEGAVTHVNTDHAGFATDAATALLGEAQGPWRVDGLDPEGCEITDGRRVRYLVFPRAAADARSLRAAFRDLAEAMRHGTVR